MRKSLFLCGCLLLLSTFLQAQELVPSFRTLEKDLLARTQPRLDLNEVPCAIVRVSAADIESYTFEGNIIGEVIYQSGEALVYMTNGTRNITIKSNKGANPAKVVAVVNWDYAGASLALADLKSQLVAEADAASLTDGFIMSNSVYLSGTEIMDATPITAANIATTETDAVAVPVDIYVERLAAKVTLTQDADKFDTGVENPYATGNLYAKVLAWDINTTISHSNLVKTIQGFWTDAALGITGWNIEAFKRSFWGESAPVSASTPSSTIP